jgi:POT family proton-dependent oligopeptide transporter
MSTGEIFAYVTALEYAHDHLPQNLKVVVQAFSLLSRSAGSAGALALASVARDPYLVAFYASLTAGMVAVTVAFWLAFHKHDAEEASAAERDACQGSIVGCQEQLGSRGAR